MKTEKVIEAVKGSFSSFITEENLTSKQPFLTVKSEGIHGILKFLKEREDLYFDFLRCLTATDMKDAIMISYHLYSYKNGHEILIKTLISKDQPKINSVCDLFGVANWYEREAFDLLGVNFENHPDLRRILLPEDWQGHPLRKDYEEPKEYCGIPATRKEMN